MKMIKSSDSIVLCQGQLCPLMGSLPGHGSSLSAFNYIDSEGEPLVWQPGGGTWVFGTAFSVDMAISANFIRLLDKRMISFPQQVLVFTQDTLFAQQRFAKEAGLQKVRLARVDKFWQQYGVVFKEGAFSGLFTHALFLIDKGKVRYLERPMELTTEPDIEALLQLIKLA